MIGNSIVFYYLWKRSKRSEEFLNDINEMKNKNEDLKKYISSRLKSISEVGDLMMIKIFQQDLKI